MMPFADSNTAGPALPQEVRARPICPKIDYMHSWFSLIGAIIDLGQYLVRLLAYLYFVSGSLAD